MLSKEEFVRRILVEAPPRAKTRSATEGPAHVAGFDFIDDVPEAEAPEDTRFAQLLLEEGFGLGQSIPRSTVIRSTDAVARYIPDQVLYWPKTPTRPHHTLLIEANLNHRELLAIPAFKSRQLAHLDIAEDALARLAAEALEGFQRGAEGLESSALKGMKHETLCVVSIIDERDGHAGRLVCFGTFNAKTEGLETFFLTEHARSWDRTDARERLGLLYERQFKKLGDVTWQEAFTTTDERKQADKLLEVCTTKNIAEKDVQESILDLLDTIAKGFGLRKKPNVERRLQAFPLPVEHDIGIDSEERESKYGGTNPFSGVTLRDVHSRLLGYIIYPLKAKADADRLRQHLERHNRFHNVLVVYPDTNQASIELWQGREQLTGKLRKGQTYKDAADVVNLLSRFFIVSKAKVRNPTELAQELAYRARYLRRLAVRELEDEPEKGPLRDLYNAFKVALVHDQKEDEFADAFAQTITYGLLTARWLGNDQLATTGERFTRQSALKYLPAASPFLNDLFKSALSVKIDEQRGRLLWLVDDIADLLDRIDVTYVFSAGDKGSDTATDPVIHFYEPFLAAYDKDLKNKRGVFFTPRPVVSYIVRNVHEMLQKEFGLEDGLASTDTWGDVAKRIDGLKIPDGTKASDPFVCILDPATGTGTFLYECIEIIERTMKDRWCCELGVESWQDERIATLWDQYVPSSLLTRLYGFELMMAPYSVANLKVSFKLQETGYRVSNKDRINIYLTNSLEPALHSIRQMKLDFPGGLALEAEAVNAIKGRWKFTILVGNPPYSDASQNLGQEFSHLIDRFRYFEGARIRERGAIRFEHVINNDYVKFWGLALKTINAASFGVVGMITSNSFLEGKSFRGLREAMWEFGEKVQILNLHGEGWSGTLARSGVQDENVFEIQTGVAITQLVKGFSTCRDRVLSYGELIGTELSKNARLTNPKVPISFTDATPDGQHYLSFVPSSGDGHEEYWTFPQVDSLFSASVDGIKTSRDGLVIGNSHDECKEKILRFTKMSESDARMSFRIGDDFDIQSAQRHVKATFDEARIARIAYRPFDIRYIYYDRELILSHRMNLMPAMLTHGSRALVFASRLSSRGFDHVMVTDTLCAHKFASHDINSRMFPVVAGQLGSLGNGVIQSYVKKLNPEAESALWAASDRERAEKLGAYLYAVANSPGYRERYMEDISQDFPRIPLPMSRRLADELTKLGSDLMRAHLLLSPVPEDAFHFVGNVGEPIAQPRLKGGHVWLGKSSRIGPLDEDIWSFTACGYQVCTSWFSAGGKSGIQRRGAPLLKEVVCEFRKVLWAIRETLRIRGEIDATIEAHGGWPGAFTTKASAS